MNTVEFHKTTTKELLAIKDRVRLLISHWGEDGNYQEAVLKTIIKRFLPKNYSIASGFVIKQNQERGSHEPSKQIDILIYNNNFPVLFSEGDFVIVSADSVEAIIEVKANLKNQNPEKVIRKANEIGQFIFNAKSNHLKPLFNGIFSYVGHERLRVLDSENLRIKIRNANNTINEDERSHLFKVNHISFNKDIFYKFWNTRDNDRNGYLYDIEDLSFSFFISNLISHLNEESVMFNNQLWFPIDKEQRSQII
ncbi:DUF6602 domain-containing protein [Flavobacterium terrigena]|uniref:DUF6602 domain-containing protein n=1 Tax=Flavobacterium terrigena TaxID=402734 RepID=A0A1H6UGR1_9FLAO|nr:DUF6602 domain-containing protein [Flavobacterium terrigena]SEI91583.1 hypothetical protein SAMN05660918_1909 [Flavobacterium terrigena]